MDQAYCRLFEPLIANLRQRGKIPGESHRKTCKAIHQNVTSQPASKNRINPALPHPAWFQWWG
jgi:hypothetical protein